jgi:hypothetical protein
LHVGFCKQLLFVVYKSFRQKRALLVYFSDQINLTTTTTTIQSITTMANTPNKNNNNNNNSMSDLQVLVDQINEQIDTVEVLVDQINEQIDTLASAIANKLCVTSMNRNGYRELAKKMLQLSIDNNSGSGGNGNSNSSTNANMTSPQQQQQHPPKSSSSMSPFRASFLGGGSVSLPSHHHHRQWGRSPAERSTISGNITSNNSTGSTSGSKTRLGGTSFHHSPIRAGVSSGLFSSGGSNSNSKIPPTSTSTTNTTNSNTVAVPTTTTASDNYTVHTSQRQHPRVNGNSEHSYNSSGGVQFQMGTSSARSPHFIQHRATAANNYNNLRTSTGFKTDQPPVARTPPIPREIMNGSPMEIDEPSSVPPPAAAATTMFNLGQTEAKPKSHRSRVRLQQQHRSSFTEAKCGSDAVPHPQNIERHLSTQDHRVVSPTPTTTTVANDTAITTAAPIASPSPQAEAPDYSGRVAYLASKREEAKIFHMSGDYRSSITAYTEAIKVYGGGIGTLSE